MALIDERGEALLGYVAQGYTLPQASRRAGVAYETLRGWLLKGADPLSTSTITAPPDVRVEPYYTYARRVRAAQVEGRKRNLPRPRQGRLPADISPAQEALILAHLGEGAPYHDACRAANVRLATFLSWLRLGGYPRQLHWTRPLDPACVAEPYAGFVRRVLDAETQAFETGILSA